MCTLTWLRSEDELQIWFNRDEQTIRPDAIPPRIYNWNDVQVVAPIDPPSGGSWLASNQHGLSVTLLNWYLLPAKAGKISRGQLVKALATLSSCDSLPEFIRQHNFSVYAPFQCVVFDTRTQQLLSWNGEQLTVTDAPKIMTSSSVETDATIKRRIDKFSQFCHQTDTASNYFEFHQQHDADFSEQSVCVHRELSRTMSHTQICVTQEQLTMRYFDGYPCEITNSTSPHEIALRLQDHR